MQLHIFWYNKKYFKITLLLVLNTWVKRNQGHKITKQQVKAKQQQQKGQLKSSSASHISVFPCLWVPRQNVQLILKFLIPAFWGLVHESITPLLSSSHILISSLPLALIQQSTYVCANDIHRGLHFVELGAAVITKLNRGKNL